MGNIERELLALCEDFIKLLYELKYKEIISEEELNRHLEQKVKFVENTKTGSYHN